MKGRRVGEGGYDGGESYVGGSFFWGGRKHFVEEALDFCLGVIFWCGEF
jgi:hypothetical protein